MQVKVILLVIEVNSKKIANPRYDPPKYTYQEAKDKCCKFGDDLGDSRMLKMVHDKAVDEVRKRKKGKF